jgi:hypothetical protein
MATQERRGWRRLLAIVLGAGAVVIGLPGAGLLAMDSNHHGDAGAAIWLVGVVAAVVLAIRSHNTDAANRARALLVLGFLALVAGAAGALGYMAAA